MAAAFAATKKRATALCIEAFWLCIKVIALTIVCLILLFTAIMKATTTGNRPVPDHMNISSLAELRELFASILAPFEGNETEINWKLRERALTILRSITRGNAPSDFPAEYVSSVRSMSDGFVKAVGSLRTSLACNGFAVLQVVVDSVGTSLDTSFLDIILTSVIRQCNSTRSLYSTAADKTVATIFNCANFNPRFISYIAEASRERNTKPRAFAMGWLILLFTVYSTRKSVFEHGNLLETTIQVIQRGLADADPNVRDTARRAFHAFKPLWPAHAET